MEIRYRPRAGTTRDIDLTVATFDASAALKIRFEELRDELQKAADTDLGDYFTFRIESPKIELQGAPRAIAFGNSLALDPHPNPPPEYSLSLPTSLAWLPMIDPPEGVGGVS